MVRAAVPTEHLREPHQPRDAPPDPGHIKSFLPFGRGCVPSSLGILDRPLASSNGRAPPSRSSSCKRCESCQQTLPHVVSAFSYSAHFAAERSPRRQRQRKPQPPRAHLHLRRPHRDHLRHHLRHHLHLVPRPHPRRASLRPLPLQGPRRRKPPVRPLRSLPLSLGRRLLRLRAPPTSQRFRSIPFRRSSNPHANHPRSPRRQHQHRNSSVTITQPRHPARPHPTSIQAEAGQRMHLRIAATLSAQRTIHPRPANPPSCHPKDQSPRIHPRIRMC